MLATLERTRKCKLCLGTGMIGDWPYMAKQNCFACGGKTRLPKKSTADKDALAVLEKRVAEHGVEHPGSSANTVTPFKGFLWRWENGKYWQVIAELPTQMPNMKDY